MVSDRGPRDTSIDERECLEFENSKLKSTLEHEQAKNAKLKVGQTSKYMGTHCRRCLKHLSVKGEAKAPGIIKLIRTKTPYFFFRTT